MTAKWLLDRTMFIEYFDEFVAAIRAIGGEVAAVAPPRPPYTWDDVNDSFRRSYSHGDCVVAYGDIDLIARVKGHGDWRPGAFATFEHFYCSRYYPRFKSFLLNQDFTILPFNEMPCRADSLFELFGDCGSIFIRPDSPLKSFTGQVVRLDSLAEDLEFVAFSEFPPDAPIVVSSPKKIAAEWRFVIANRKVIAGSQYKRDGEVSISPNCDYGAIRFAEQILRSDFEPDSVWMLDICQTADNRFHLLEIGGFSHSNLYACDKYAVATAVSSVAIEIHKGLRSRRDT